MFSVFGPASLARPLVSTGVLLVLLLVGACVRLVEPPRDLRLVMGLEALAAETEALFESHAASTAAERAARYAALAEKAAGLAVLAEARAAAMAVPPGSDAYAVATAGYLADYSRNLGWLAGQESVAGSYGLLAPQVALRHAAMRDALNDALFYERDVLDRRPPAA